MDRYVRKAHNGYFIKGKLKVLNTDVFGYLITQLYCNNVSKDVKIHRLVATAFILNTENKPEVNHIDGNK